MGNHGVFIATVSVLFFKFYLFLKQAVDSQGSKFKRYQTLIQKILLPPLVLLRNGHQFPIPQTTSIISEILPFLNYLAALGDKCMNIYFSVLSFNTLWIHGRVFTDDMQNPGTFLITWDKFKWSLGQRYLKASPSVAL